MMQNIRILLSFLLIFCGGIFTMFSQIDMADSTIIGNIQAEGNITIVQPDRLATRLAPGALTVGEYNNSENVNVLLGYRIQVFADNNPRTAKNEAMIKERNIISRFPNLQSYLTYRAPSWRLRVGDFRTREEAVAAMEEIKKEFPTYSRELIVVRDKINVSF